MKNSNVENNSGRKTPRKASGFSMLTMLALTLVVTITIVGTGSFLIPFIRSNATDALTELQARSIAESSINYGLALLNDPATRADIDVSSSQDDCREVTIQASDLNLPTQIAKNLKGIRLYVRNDKPTAPTPPLQTDIFPLSYDPQLVAAPGSIAKFNNTNYLRTFTVLVEYGGDLNRGSYSFGAKAVIKPGLLTAKDGSSPTNNSSFFTGAVAAQNTVTMGENSRTISSNDSTPDGNIKAGGNISVGDQAFIDGKIQSTGAQADISIQIGANPTLNNQVEYIANEPTINGNPITNPDVTPPVAVLTPFTEGPYFATSPAPPKSGQADSSATYQNMPPALTAGPETANFASAGGSTLSGDYTINSSQLSQSNIQGLNNISSPTRLFLQNTGDINTPLEITANLGSSSAANQLQLWYNGERPLVFKGDSVNLMVYAPYSNITVGNGAKVTSFTGGIVGNNVSVAKNSSVKFAPGTSGNNFSSTAFTFDPNNASAKNTVKWQVQSIKELRYQEFVAESFLRPRKT